MISLRIQVQWMDGFQRRLGRLERGACRRGRRASVENKYTCLPLMHRAALAAMQIRPGFLRRTASSVRQPLPPGSPSARSLTADETLGEECANASSLPPLPPPPVTPARPPFHLLMMR